MQAFVLYLLWHCPDPSSYHPVGRLVRVPVNGGMRYEFTYLKGALFVQERHGFEPIAGGFPHHSKRYISDELFPFFANRLMAKSRLDYAEYLEQLGIAPDPQDTLLVLARGGKKATDSFETFEYPRFEPVTQRLQVHFWMRGIRHAPSGADERCLQLNPEQRLHASLDPTPEDPLAVAIHRDVNEPRVGHLPQVLTREFATLTKLNGEAPAVVAAHVNQPPLPIQQRVLCRMEAPWPASYIPFIHEAMQPLAPDAWDLPELMDSRTREIHAKNMV
jgi:hypothetical protein